MEKNIYAIMALLLLNIAPLAARHNGFGSGFAGGFTGGIFGSAIGSAATRPRETVVVREQAATQEPTQRNMKRWERELSDWQDELDERARELRKKERMLAKREEMQKTNN